MKKYQTTWRSYAFLLVAARWSAACESKESAGRVDSVTDLNAEVGVVYILVSEERVGLRCLVSGATFTSLTFS